MKIESLLPLGKLDPGLREPDTPLDVRDFARLSKVAEDVGLDAVLVEETKDDPFQMMALGATTTERIQLGTSVAMAFPRSPTATAMSAWSLAKLGEGRFMLGLGTQVRAHIQRRFGLDWHAPAPWMRDYIGAIRAVWRCWQDRTPLEFESEHYTLNLMVPLFDPGPIDHPDIPIHVAVIGPNMTAMAGECADGIRLHPVVTTKYIDEEVLPNLAQGAARAGRDVDEVEVCLKPLIGTAPDEARLEQVIRTVRARCAFCCRRLRTDGRLPSTAGRTGPARRASTAGPAGGRRCRISSMTTCSTRSRRSGPTTRSPTNSTSVSPLAWIGSSSPFR